MSLKDTLWPAGVLVIQQPSLRGGGGGGVDLHWNFN